MPNINPLRTCLSQHQLYLFAHCSLRSYALSILSKFHFRITMATEITKPNDTKPSHEAPEETLNSTVPPTAKPDRPEDPNCDNSSAPPSLTFDSATSELKKDGDEFRTNEAVVGSAPANSSVPTSDIEKKIFRAERFGISVQLTEEEKRNSRAERFRTGSAVYGSESGKGAEELKRKARAERFGLTSSSLPSDEETKKKARLARFAPASNTNPLEEAKRKARAARFASTLTSSISEVNGKGNIEPEATIIGKAAGGT